MWYNKLTKEEEKVVTLNKSVMKGMRGNNSLGNSIFHEMKKENMMNELGKEKVSQESSKAFSTINGMTVAIKNNNSGEYGSNIINIASKYALGNVKIIKKDGTKENYDIQKVVKAIKKSAARMLVDFSEKELNDIYDLCQKEGL